MNRRDLIKISASVAAAPAALAQTAAWKPLLFDAHQNDTVAALADLIIPATDTPGAKAAGVNRYIDLLLNDGPVEQRNEFLAGLAYLDGQAIAKHGQPFVKCTAAQQTAILTDFDKGSGPGSRFFRMAKMMTSRIYYSTEIGTKELNKGGIPASYGCQHPAHK
jgi:hypothetical protein